MISIKGILAACAVIAAVTAAPAQQPAESAPEGADVDEEFERALDPAQFQVPYEPTTRLDRAFNEANEAIGQVIRFACRDRHANEILLQLQDRYDQLTSQAEALLGRYVRTEISLYHCRLLDPNPAAVARAERRAHFFLRRAAAMIRRGETD